MSLRQLSAEACKDGLTCPGIWVDDEAPEDVVVVGKVLPSGMVPLGPDEVAVRMVYDEQGHFVRPELGADLPAYLEVKSIVVGHGVDLMDYLREWEPRLIA